MKLIAILSALALAVPACGPAGDPTDRPGAEIPPPGDGAVGAGSLLGILDGDAQLEGGCVWIEPTGGPDADLGDRLELLLPADLRVEFEPDLRLLDAQGTVVAARGDELVVDGRPAEDVVTVCQVGPAYEVEAITGTVGR